MSQDNSFDDLVQMAQQATDEERRQLLDQLVTQFAEAAFRWAVVILQDESAASDAVQEAWLNAYLHLDQLRESGAFPAWFRQIVLTTCYRAIHHEERNQSGGDEPSEEIASPSDPQREIEQRERLDKIREAVLALPEHERIVTELFYFDEYPQQEIAKVLAVPVTTVKKRLQYARTRLKGLIQQEVVSQLGLSAFDGGSTAAAVGDIFDDMDDPAQWLTEWATVGLIQRPDSSPIPLVHTYEPVFAYGSVVLCQG